MDPEIIVKPIDRGMRIDYEPINELAKLLAATCDRRCLAKWQLDIWKKTGVKITETKE